MRMTGVMCEGQTHYRSAGGAKATNPKGWLECTPIYFMITPMLEQRIGQQFIDSADLKYQAAEQMSKPIAAAIQALMACVTNGGKVLACGNGGSAADCQHFAAEFVGRFELCL